MADNIPLSFLVGLDISELESNAEKMKRRFEDISRKATEEGHNIDSLFNQMGQSFSTSMTDRLRVLKAEIDETESLITKELSNIKKYSEDAQKAFAAGDLKGWDLSNKDIADAEKAVADLTAKLTYQKQVYEELRKAAGEAFAPATTANRLFTSEEEYNQVKELEAAIESLKQKRAELATDDDLTGNERTKQLTEVNAEIIKLQDNLGSLNQKAAEAAAALGDHLGGKAAESSTRLYELNAALAAQQQTYDDLVQKLEDVAQKMEAATAAGDVSQLKDLQLEYQHLAEQVENAYNALQETKGEQKDAAESWGNMLETISSLGQEVGNSTQTVGKAVTSFSQLAAAFKNSKNPVQTFRSALQAMRGGMGLTQISVKGLISGLKALWKALLSNPITAILVAITALVAGFVAIANSIKSAAEKQALLNAAEKTHLELLKQITENSDRGYDQTIKAKERELRVLKAGNSSLQEQYKLEDEILRLKKEKAEKAKELWQEETNKIDENTAALERQQKAIAALELRSDDGADMTWRQVNRRMAEQGMNVEYRRSGFLGWGRKELYVDGVRVSKGATEDMMKDVQGQIDNSKTKLEMGVKVEADVEDANAAIEEAARARAEKAKSIAKAETAEIRAATAANNALISDAYEREIAVAKTASANKIADLKRRLSEEADLTARARLAINQQILAEEKALQSKLLTLEAAQQAKILAIRRQTEDVLVDSGAKTAQERIEALTRQYDRLYDDVINKIDTGRTNKTLSEGEIEELYKLADAYRKRQKAEEAILNLQLQQQAIETERETINLRLAAVRQGTLEELNLRLQLIEAERRAELQANKLKPEDQRQDEEEINAKYRKQREDEERAFYGSVIGDYVAYQQEMTDLTEAYEKRRADIEQQIAQEKDPKKKQALRASLAELEKTYKASLKNLQQEFIKNNIGEVFSEQTVENIKEAKRALDEMEGMSLDDFNLAYNAQLTAEQFENLKEQIRKVRNELRDMGKGYSLKEAFSDAFTGKTKEEVQRGVDYLVNGLGKVSSIVGGLADAMREFAEATNNAKLEQMADTFQDIADTISTAGSYAAAGAQIGGGWGAVIGAVLGIGQGVITAIFKSEAQEKEEERVRTEEAHDYLDDVISGIGSLISSVDSLHNTISSLDYSNYRKSLLDAINSLRSDANYDSESNWRNLRNGADTFAAFSQLDWQHLWNLFRNFDLPHFIESWSAETQAAFEKLKNHETLSEEDLRRLMNLYLGWGHGVSGNITSQYANQENHKDYELDLRRKELIKEMNDLYEKGSLDALEYFNILLKGDQLSLDLLRQKKNELLGQGYSEDSDEVIDLENKIAEATYNIRERVREMFEGLAGIDMQSLANKWLDIFKEFGDNLTTVFEKIDESIDDMIRNIIYQTVFVQPLMQRLNQVIENYQRQLAQQQNIDTSQEGWQANVDWSAANFTQIAEDMRTTGHGIADLWEQVRQQLSAAGLGIGNDSANDRSAQAKGIATASQDSVDELNGRAATIQSHTFTISENSNIIRDNVSAILSSVRRIEYNTEELHALRSDLHGLKDTIEIHGVRLRN